MSINLDRRRESVMTVYPCGISMDNGTCGSVLYKMVRTFTGPAARTQEQARTTVTEERKQMHASQRKHARLVSDQAN